MSKLKTDDAGNAVLKDGLPVWILDSGEEVAYDAPKLHETVGKIRKERDGFESAAKEAQAALSRFGSSEEDRAKAADKLKLALALDDKKLVDAGKVEEVVAERLKPFAAERAAERAELERAVQEKDAHLRKVLISNRFAGTKALEGTFLTPKLAEAMFGSQFDIEGDEVVAFRDPSRKEKLYSKTDPGKVADFDESLGTLVTSHPDFKHWKRGTGSTGGDAPGAVGGSGGGKVMQRDQFFALDPAGQMDFVKSGGKVADAA